MVVHIVIAGESQCEMFAQVCLVADYLSQNLPNFCYERIEKPVLEWKTWLCKINQKYKWHHKESPLVWKEMLIKGSKASYIGGATDFLDYCYSYYQFDSYLASEKFEGLVKNFNQYQKKLHEEKHELSHRAKIFELSDRQPNANYVVSIMGAGNPITMYIISGLLGMSSGNKKISKIYIYDSECTEQFMELVEQECSYIGACSPGKVVKYVDKIGVALTHTDLLIILDHVPFKNELPIGDWLNKNKKMMENISLMINASANRKMYVLFPNLGPACYNATILMNMANINKNNIVVATSDLGLEILVPAAEIAQVPLKNIFCPPVWGFVGINHLVDIRTTIHKYNTFEPYNRYVKVRNSTLNIGSVTPEMRTMEYLMYFDDTLWSKVAENKENRSSKQIPINKAIAILNVVKMWLFEPTPDQIINLGIRCNGSFGLNFDGAFSQPAQFVDGEWTPANNFMRPKDSQMKLSYLEQIAKLTMTLKKKDLPQVIPFYPCTCKPKYYNKKGVW